MGLIIGGALAAAVALVAVALGRAAARGDSASEQAIRERRIRHHYRNVREAQ